MKTILTSQSLLLALLMVVLLLSSPLATLAQQVSAEIQAKQDAKSDVNKVAWFTAGFIGCASGWMVLVLSDEIENPLRRPLVCLGMMVPLLPIVYATSTSSAPPTERLLGKPPEYVDVYVDSYTKEVKRQQVISSASGCAVGYVSTAIILLAHGVLDIQ